MATTKIARVKPTKTPVKAAKAWSIETTGMRTIICNI